MTEPVSHVKAGRFRWAIVLLIVLAAVAGMTLLAAANTRVPVSITITNNSQLQIRGLYLAPGNPDNWGPDQLNGSTIAPGTSFTLNNVACEGSSIRVIAEDQNGCFLYHNVSCDANSAWTISNNETPDCGGN